MALSTSPYWAKTSASTIRVSICCSSTGRRPRPRGRPATGLPPAGSAGAGSNSIDGTFGCGAWTEAESSRSITSSWYSGGLAGVGPPRQPAAGGGAASGGADVLQLLGRLDVRRVGLERPAIVLERGRRVLPLLAPPRRARRGPSRGPPGCPQPRAPAPASRAPRRGAGRPPESARGSSAACANSRRATAASHGRRDHGDRAVRAPAPASRSRHRKTPRRLGVGVELEGLLGRPHRLGPLAHLELRLGEEREALGRAGRGLQDGHGRVRVVLGEQRPDEVLLRLDVVGRELEGLLEDLRGLVVRSALQQHRADQAVLHHGLVLLVGGAVEVREADLDAHVGRVDRRHLLVDGDGVGDPVVLLVVVGQDLVLAAGVLDEALLVVQVGELVVDLELRGVDLVDLLEDRDRLQEEAVLRE